MLVGISVECRSIVDRYVDRELFDSRSTLSQHSVDSWSRVGQWSVDIATDYWPTISHYWADVSRWSTGQISVEYRSSVGDVSVNCHANITRVG